MYLLLFLYPHILIPSGSCVLVGIRTSLHPHTFRFMCAFWHPCILTSLYPEIYVCLLASLHPHILIYSGSCVFGCLLISSNPFVIFPGLFVFACILASSHPDTLGLMRVCWCPCLLMSSFSCAFPFILGSCHPHMLRVCLLVFSHPHVLRSFGSCDSIGWLISSRPHIMKALYPNILSSSHSQHCLCLLARSHLTPSHHQVYVF